MTNVEILGITRKGVKFYAFDVGAYTFWISCSRFFIRAVFFTAPSLSNNPEFQARFRVKIFGFEKIKIVK